MVVALGVGLLSAACTPDGSGGTGESTEPEAVAEPEISVTVPPERLTPFCEAMIDLSDELRSGSAGDTDDLIISTYRSIQADVPLEIAADFDLVLSALEAGLPSPTDPPIEATTPTTTSASDPTASGAPGEAVAGEGSVDEGFSPDSSPAERINSYVDFDCRGTENNPGPPATQPGDRPADEESSDENT